MTDKTTTLLWALRSWCAQLGCDYCYFGTLEEHQVSPPTRPGQLTHLPHGDLHLADVRRFLAGVGDSGVRRVFLAGGEPLSWAPIGEVIATLAGAGVEVIVCTNGIPLNQAPVRALLCERGVAAVSVSLDSSDAALNDLHRRARSGGESWSSVVDGITALLETRGDAATPKVGVYSVITRLTLPGLLDTARFVAGLGVDYFVAQPVALDPGHKLHAELALREEDLPLLEHAFADLAAAQLGLALPGEDYPPLVASTVRHGLQTKTGCFGGHQLGFVEPDGTVWDCPSTHKISRLARRGARPNIATSPAAELFPATTSRSDCPLFSSDCVNMLPLMDFDRFTGADR
jgi:MoaA/NifB/PqqE/SkfB family radical SAM enzyme